MKKYQFKSKASLDTFVEGIKPEKIKVNLEENSVEIVAYSECEEEKDESELMYRLEDMQYQMKYMWSEMEYMWQTVFSHINEGHLPPIKGAGNMETALKALGMDKDYEVVKPTLYANSRGDFEIDLSLLKKDE